MGERTRWWQVRKMVALWRWHHSPEFAAAMADYWSGNRCRFCDRYAGVGRCPVGLGVCDFRVGRP